VRRIATWEKLRIATTCPHRHLESNRQFGKIVVTL